jgi:hypothetical protein
MGALENIRRPRLQQRLRHALEIAENAVKHLADAGYCDPQEPGNNLPPDKLLAETAFLLVAASAATPQCDFRGQIDRIATKLIPLARSKRVLLALTLQPALALDFAHAHLCLSRLGYGDSLFDAHVRRALCAQVASSRERVPYRMLELEWVQRSWKAAHGGIGSLRGIRPAPTILSHPVDIFGATAEDFYAFTHAILYYRDFNVAARPLPRARAVILGEAEGLLARAIDNQDYDIAAELLMAWPLTGKRWSAGATFGFAVLAHVEDEVGFLPAASTRVERIQQLGGAKRRQYVLATAYHTAYVMGILCAVALQAGRSPRADIASGTKSTAARTMISSLMEEGAPRHWHKPFASLAAVEQETLSPFLLAMRLHRAVARRDFVAVGTLLKIAHSEGISGDPACGQAAALLHRMSELARTVDTEPRKAKTCLVWRASSAVSLSSGSATPTKI